MDNCCFNRVFDDRTNPKIYFDRNSVMIIIEFAEKRFIDLCGSQMLIKEINDTADANKKEKLKLIYSLCSEEILVNEEIAKRAVEIQNNSNIRAKDSIHLACGEYANVDVLLTVDKKFKNNANRLPANIRVMEPTEWLMEVLYGYGN